VWLCWEGAVEIASWQYELGDAEADAVQLYFSEVSNRLIIALDGGRVGFWLRCAWLRLRCAILEKCSHLVIEEYINLSLNLTLPTINMTRNTIRKLIYLVVHIFAYLIKRILKIINPIITLVDHPVLPLIKLIVLVLNPLRMLFHLGFRREVFVKVEILMTERGCVDSCKQHSDS
jgi:hypothetical protein